MMTLASSVSEVLNLLMALESSFTIVICLYTAGRAPGIDLSTHLLPWLAVFLLGTLWPVIQTVTIINDDSSIISK
jgi:hypothetical protein